MLYLLAKGVPSREELAKNGFELGDEEEGKIEIISFDAEQGVVTFSAKSDDVNDIYKYIDQLLNQSIFMKVDHTGYTYDDSTGLYDIHVQCTLAESVGRDLD